MAKIAAPSGLAQPSTAAGGVWWLMHQSAGQQEDVQDLEWLDAIRFRPGFSVDAGTRRVPPIRNPPTVTGERSSAG